MSSAAKSARRSLQGLVWIIVILFGLLTLGVTTHQKDASFAPLLGLDLEGGVQIILKAKTTGDVVPDASDMKQAVEIIRKRVDASGTSEAEITTQGDLNIIVSLPGDPDQATLDLVRKSAQLQFRPVLVQQQVFASSVVLPSASPSTDPTPSPTASADTLTGSDTSATPTPSASAAGADTAGIDTMSPASEVANVKTAASANPSASPSPTPSAAPAVTDPAVPTNPSDPAWITPEVIAAFAALDCTDQKQLTDVPLGDPEAAFATCGSDGQFKYILGPVEMTGTDVATASSGPNITQANTSDGTYAVFLKMTGSGGTKFADTTRRLNGLSSPLNQFGILLDGVVISAPSVTKGAITGGDASISGSFTQASAQQLANQLKFGALPLTLEVDSEQNIAATKGANELQSGMIAGLIGLILVVVYSLFQYRALGAVTVGSLVVAGGMTYLVIALLSWGIGYRLSLAGVAGLIVAIGITADSFIVYFERVKDELREGRSLVAAVEHGWRRARRTILAADAVNFLAALVLYILAVGNVRGFAFTLGLTTLVDLVVVFMFTHPTLGLLARTKFFGDGHRFSGLDPKQLGRDVIYKGRGRVSTGEAKDEPKLTLAERKAQKARASASAGEKE